MINLWPQFCRSIIVFRLNHLHSRKFSLTLKVRPSLTLSSLGPVTPLACVVYLNVFLTHFFFVQLTEFHPSKNGEEEK